MLLDVYIDIIIYLRNHLYLQIKLKALSITRRLAEPTWQSTSPLTPLNFTQGVKVYKLKIKIVTFPPFTS